MTRRIARKIPTKPKVVKPEKSPEGLELYWAFSAKGRPMKVWVYVVKALGKAFEPVGSKWTQARTVRMYDLSEIAVTRDELEKVTLGKEPFGWSVDHYDGDVTAVYKVVKQGRTYFVDAKGYEVYNKIVHDATEAYEILNKKLEDTLKNSIKSVNLAKERVKKNKILIRESKKAKNKLPRPAEIVKVEMEAAEKAETEMDV